MMFLQQIAGAPAAPTTPIQSGATSMQLDALQTEEILAVQNLVTVEGNRAEVLQELKTASGARRGELNKSLADMDAEIAKINARLTSIRDRISQTTPMQVLAPPPPMAIMEIPPEPGMFGLTKDEFVGASSFLVLFPLALAFSHSIWRRTRFPAKSVDGGDRLARLEQAVEAVAVEVERIGESHRFQSKLMAERERETVSPTSMK